jgi:hypothetical protein
MIDGMSGSMISASLMRHRKRRVTPRMYSFGCCRLLRRFWQMRIISGRMRPSEPVFSMISMYSSSSFCTVWSSEGST